MNRNNLAQKTNYIAGSDKFDELPFYLINVNIPGINFSYPEVGGRGGAKLNLAGDSITYNTLSFEMLIDEDFLIYHEFMDKITEGVSIENSTFRDDTFNFWVEINNSKGNKLFKLEFNNCRIESIGDILLDTQDEITEFTMSVEIKYDNYTIIKSTQKPVLSV